MCGVAGLVRLNAPAGPEHRTLVQRMCALQNHRGPDDADVIAIDNVCFGSSRLRIIDLSNAGHMPMSDASGRWWITYNGEIYNFPALRRELVTLGHEFRSHSDTEVVLHAFMQWGEACLDRLAGMFAFAIFDRDRETVTLARDRYGIKPLYFMHRNEEIVFSSEMKPLIMSLSTPRIDRQSLVEWSLYKNVDALTPPTLVEGVNALLPGHVATIRNGEMSIRAYYSLPAQVTHAQYRQRTAQSDAAITDEFDARLKQCVREHMVSDVPIGTFISGGLDSSVVTAMAAEYSQDLTGYHVSVKGRGAVDEREHAETVARRFNIPLACCELTGEAFRRELPRAIFQSDVPLTHPNSVAYSLISRLARERGAIVLLSGEGADELFGGYSFRYRRQQQLLRFQPLLKWLPDKLRMALGLVGFVSVGLPVTGFHYRQLLPHTAAFIDSYARREWLEKCEHAYAFVENRNERAVLAAMLADIGDFLAPLLRRLDRMTMSASVECRVPYLDHRLVHQVINLPLSQRLRGRSDKWLLKRIGSRYLPQHIVERKKEGFPLPLRDYLAPLGHMDLFDGGFCVNVLGLRRVGLSDVVRAWPDSVIGSMSLLSLELWGRMYFMKQSVEEVEALIRHVEAKTARGRSHGGLAWPDEDDPVTKGSGALG